MLFLLFESLELEVGVGKGFDDELCECLYGCLAFSINISNDSFAVGKYCDSTSRGEFDNCCCVGLNCRRIF